MTCRLRSFSAADFVVVLIMYRKQVFMIVIEIIDIKNFMAHLLLKDTFDHFLLFEARAVTASELLMKGGSGTTVTSGVGCVRNGENMTACT